MSEKTITPLKFVPDMIIYYDGRPLMRYEGAYNDAYIKKFVLDIANNMQKKQQFAKNQVKEPQAGTGIPAYCIGKPISGDKGQQVCYLSNESAYKKVLTAQ